MLEAAVPEAATASAVPAVELDGATGVPDVEEEREDLEAALSEPPEPAGAPDAGADSAAASARLVSDSPSADGLDSAAGAGADADAEVGAGAGAGAAPKSTRMEHDRFFSLGEPSAVRTKQPISVCQQWSDMVISTRTDT